MSHVTELGLKGLSGRTSSADFCRIFAEDMTRLYLLGLLLTADAEKAEQCFVAGIEDCVEGNPVFKEWARSWARRTIVQHAIQMIRPAENKAAVGKASPPNVRLAAELEAVLRLDALERFVYVMSVLEGYSIQDCSLLLGCSRQVVMKARSRATGHLAAAPDVGAAPSNVLQRADVLPFINAKLGLAV